MNRQKDIVVTTIFEPEWLEGYLSTLAENGQKEHVTLRIICDQKTPASVFAAAKAAQDQGFKIDCPSLDEQTTFLARVGLDNEFIPWNTDNRRNIGFLRAWESGADVLISIDDDNYCLPGSDFVGEHEIVGSSTNGVIKTQFADDAPWFNICELLQTNSATQIFARGFPYAARTPESCAQLVSFSTDQAARKIAINAGLWIDDPDVDAMSRLTLAPRVSGALPDPVILGPKTWSPINTQNTALIRDAIPAYYYVRMGYPLEGLKIDRFGDILSGYFVQKCAQHHGHAIRLGTPVAEHRRSAHNLFKDLYQELAGIVLIEEFLPWLMEAKLEGDNYNDSFASLADAIEANADRFHGFVWDEGGREFLKETAASMRTWLKVIARLS